MAGATVWKPLECAGQQTNKYRKCERGIFYSVFTSYKQKMHAF